MTTLVLMFKNTESEDKTKHDTFYSHSKAERTINESGIDDLFEINLYYNFIKHTKIFRERLRLNY